MQKILKILLVEDSPLDAGLLMEQMNLLEEACIDVKWVDSLSNAVCCCNDHSIDAALLDLGLPDSTGLETVKRFENACPNVPVIVLSGSVDQAIGIEAVRSGVQDYLVKGQVDGPLILRSIRYAIERKRTANALRKSERELADRNRELESIISFISHDLRTPLVNIKGFSKELGKDCANLKAQLAKFELPSQISAEISKLTDKYIPTSVSFIENSTDFMNNVVTSLIQVARAGMSATKPEQVDVNAMMTAILGNLETKIRQAEVDIKMSSMPACVADKTQLTQIFTNIIDNAIKYRHQGRKGIIIISGAVKGSEAVYTIQDNGIGMLPPDIDKIFEMFYRLGEKETGGEGIGLSIAKRMIERNNGRIWVESEIDKGSRFFVALPLTTSA